MDNLTIGNWATEAESAAALDAALSQVNMWTVYREVCGTLSQPRPSQVDKAVRIDRILVPNQWAIQAGWSHGNIGIEIKRSGVKVGPAIAQAMDYSRTVWTLPSLGGIKVWLDWVFIWPMTTQYETVGSILAQNRIGTASCDQRSRLRLMNGQQNIFAVRYDGTYSVGDAINGRKVGSR